MAEWVYGIDCTALKTHPSNGRKNLKAHRTRYVRFIGTGTGEEHWISFVRIRRYGKHAFRSRQTGNTLLYQGEQQLV